MSTNGIAPATHNDVRVMIVTGASSGIGRSLAKFAAAQGYAILAVGRDAGRLEQTAVAIREAGGRCETLRIDVTAAGAPQRIVDSAVRTFGRIDVVVNNAGAGTSGNLLTQSDAQIDAQIQLHVGAPLRISRAALPWIRKTHGGIVFVGSGVARVPVPGYGAYCLAKAAIRAAAIQLRRELRSEGLFVTYVDPGAVATGFSTAAGMEDNDSSLRAKPDRVARRILRGIQRRASRVNAVPLHTIAAVLGEWMPALADASLSRIVAKPATTLPESPSEPVKPAEPVAETSPVAPVATSDFERALEPVARRMERVKLSQTFVRDLLAPPATIELHDVAMRWAGMPNKNERAAMREVLDALTAAGYLESTGEETWTVLRAAE
jgi:short-subunit dehydrogenase